MNPREEILFDAAVQLPPERRSAHLDEVCGNDSSLRERVELLLKSHEEAGTEFLEPRPRAQDPNKTLVSRPSVTEELPNTLIGHYRLLEKVGEGGFGVVYVAEQREPVKRRVALKIIKLGMDTRQVVARFEVERQALAVMDHPNIAKVFDAGATETGRPYFVMELVRGVRITDYCDQNNLPTRERLELFRKVCLAIQHAHQKGVIHRDIKPSNLLVTLHDGVPVPKVIDFGIAKATHDELTDKTVYTQLQQFIGTPAYMSPEQAEMSGLDMDTRSDIYSLGVLLYELLTGRTPFDQKELLDSGLDGMRRIIREQEPRRPSTRVSLLQGEERTTTARRHGLDAFKLVRLLQGDLDWIVMKCLEKDRTRRYETANGLAMDLQRHLSNETVLARPPSRLYRWRKMARRNRGALLAALTAVGALVLAVIGLAVSNLRITRERNRKVVALSERSAAVETAQESERRAREQLFLALRSQSQARRYSRQMGQRLDSLAALTEAAHIRPDGGLRDDAIAAMARPDLRRGPSWPGLPVGTRTIRFDSLYERYAFTDETGVICIRRSAGGGETQRITGSAAVQASSAGQSMLFSPDGRFLAILETGNLLQVRRLSDGQSILRARPEGCIGLAFSPDSGKLAVGQEGWILCFDLSSGEETKRWPARAVAHALAFHPDNRRLAVGYVSAAEVSVYDVNSGVLDLDLPVGSGSYEIVAWDPDGRCLAATGSDPAIQIWDVAARRKLATLAGHVQQVGQISFHPAGGLLASGSWDGTVRFWDPVSGRQLMQLPSQVSIRFSPDGRWLGARTREGQLELLEVTPTLEYRTFASSRGTGIGSYSAGDISPDGRVLAVGMDDGVRLWELPSGRELAFVAAGPTTDVFFTRAGKELITCGEANGLQRWAILEASPVREFRLGLPERLPLPFAPTRAALHRQTRSVAVVGETAGEAMLLNLDSGSSGGRSLSHPQGCFVALSGDGQWIATGGWHSRLVRLWNAQTGRLARQWDTGESTMVLFTPDSQTLIICQGEEFGFWDLHTLQLSLRLKRDAVLYPGPVAFSPDARMMALEMEPGIVHLKEVRTGRTIAKLEDPFGDRATWMAFSPDGTQLIIVANYASVIHLWNLRSIRVQLKSMGLDWDWPEFPIT